jgi:hypothetical protein
MARRNIWARDPEGAIRVMFAGSSRVLPDESVNNWVPLTTGGETVSFRGEAQPDEGSKNRAVSITTATVFFRAQPGKTNNFIITSKWRHAPFFPVA